MVAGYAPEPKSKVYFEENYFVYIEKMDIIFAVFKNHNAFKIFRVVFSIRLTTKSLMLSLFTSRWNAAERTIS